MSAQTLRALMHHHRDVRRLRPQPTLVPAAICIVVLIAILGLAFVARAWGAPLAPSCPGLPPSCHLHQHPECLCSGPSVTQCKWTCVWEAKGASE